MKVTWLQHLELLRLNNLVELWVLSGVQGIGKTSTANGIIRDLKAHGWTVTTRADTVADVLYWDDLGKYFSKRNWSSKKGIEVARFIQVMRTLYTLILTTAPALKELDISIRESEVVEIIHVIRPGFAIWRDPIVVQPVWDKSESWRRDYGLSLQKKIEVA